LYWFNLERWGYFEWGRRRLSSLYIKKEDTMRKFRVYFNVGFIDKSAKTISEAIIAAKNERMMASLDTIVKGIIELESGKKTEVRSR